MTSTPEHPEHWPTDDFVPTEELARRRASSRSPRSTSWPSRTCGSPTRSTRPSSPTSTPPAAPASRELRRRRHRRRLGDPQGAAPRRPRPPARRQQLAITFVTVGELTQWTYLHRWGPRSLDGLRAFFASVVVLPCSFQRSPPVGRDPGPRPAPRRPRPVNDSWIAACCLARELPLATLNIKDYADFAEHEGLELVH